jgi:hypothetical protein
VRALSVTVTVATMMSILPDCRYGMRLPDAGRHIAAAPDRQRDDAGQLAVLHVASSPENPGRFNPVGVRSRAHERWAARSARIALASWGSPRLVAQRWEPP